MAFALWADQDTAWAAGTHEYRPMGVAVVAITDAFRPRDFVPGRRPPKSTSLRFHGLYASLQQVNAHLRRLRTHPIPRDSTRRSLSRILPIV